MNIERIQHSIKTALACLIGFAVTKLLHIGVDQWLIITILVVMCGQINVGSMLKKSYMRFLGTLLGSLLAVLTLLLFGNHPVSSALAIAFAAIIFSFIATSDRNYSESGTLGAATVAIILMGQHPTLITAGERFLEISLGILIAALASQFIFPIHASKHLRRNQAKTLLMLRDYYKTTFFNAKPPEDHQFLDEDIAKELIKQRRLAAEAKQELFGDKFNVTHFRFSLWCEKEILRSVVFMYHAYQAANANVLPLANIMALKAFHEEIILALEAIANNIENNQAEAIILPDIKQLETILDQAKTELSENEKIPVDAFFFCAKTLVLRMKKLVSLNPQMGMEDVR